MTLPAPPHDRASPPLEAPRSAAWPPRGSWWPSLLAVPALWLAWTIAPQYDASGIGMAPLSPALAVALAATALSGWRALPAVVLGLALALAGPSPGGEGTPPAWNTAVILAQAAFGGLLLRRSSRGDDLALDTPGALQRLVAAALSSGLLALLATLSVALWTSATARPYTVAAVRGLCDAGSVMLLLPVLLALAAPPRARWAARRRSVALPLLALAGALWLVFAAVDARDRQHAEARFERDADAMAAHARLLIGADGGAAPPGAPAAGAPAACAPGSPCPGPALPVPAERLATTLLAARTDALRLCIFHEDARAEPRRLQGPQGCDSAAPVPQVFRRDAVLERAGQRWLMRIEQPVQTPGGVWLFAVPALAGGALLSWLLLSMTGRLQRLQDDARVLGHEMHGRAARQLDAVMGVVPAGMALLAPDGRILRANDLLAAMVQRPMSELLQSPITDLLVDAQAGAATPGLGDLLRDGGAQATHLQMRLRLPDGQSVPVRVGFHVAREADGRVATAACAVHLLAP